MSDSIGDVVDTINKDRGRIKCDRIAGDCDAIQSDRADKLGESIAGEEDRPRNGGRKMSREK